MRPFRSSVVPNIGLVTSREASSAVTLPLATLEVPAVPFPIACTLEPTLSSASLPTLMVRRWSAPSSSRSARSSVGSVPRTFAR
jgi:hypothetical protein